MYSLSSTLEFYISIKTFWEAESLILSFIKFSNLAIFYNSSLTYFHIVGT